MVADEDFRFFGYAQNAMVKGVRMTFQRGEGYNVGLKRDCPASAMASFTSWYFSVAWRTSS